MLDQNYDYDLFVIGAGSGGVRAARMTAARGYKVAVAEEKYLGGTCVNVGCVPKKLLVYASHFSEDFENAKGFGWQMQESAHDWPTLINNKDHEIQRLNGIYRHLLNGPGVDIFDGRARIIDKHTVEVNGKSIRAGKILLTVGCTPTVPEFPGSDLVITSDQAFYLARKPEKVIVVGAGYIAVEFAGIFNGLGVDTHLFYRGDKILRTFDSTLADFTAAEIEKKGIQIHYQTQIESIERLDSGKLECLLDSGERIQADEVMYATGRHALTANLGLENTQVACRENGTIIVNENFSTAEPSIFALGDVIGTLELTPVALAQAMVFIDQHFPVQGELKGDVSRAARVMSYDAIPTAVFCQPNLSTVGLSEEAAKEESLACDVYISEFKHLKHTLSGSSERVLMKMIVDAETQVVVGMHMAGPDAGEVIQGFAVAVKAGLTKQQLDETIGIHPTAAEEFVTLREIKYSFS